MEKSLRISDIVKKGSNQINEIFKNYFISKGNIDDQQYWSNRFQEELIRYITAEELIVYPQFEKYLHEKGKKISADHQEMKKLLFILETTSISDPQYDLTFNQLIEIFNQHIQREEEIYLPILEKLLTSDFSQSLAQSFEQTKNSNHLKVYPRSALNTPL